MPPDTAGDSTTWGSGCSSDHSPEAGTVRQRERPQEFDPQLRLPRFICARRWPESATSVWATASILGLVEGLTQLHRSSSAVRSAPRNRLCRFFVRTQSGLISPFPSQRGRIGEMEQTRTRRLGCSRLTGHDVDTAASRASWSIAPLASPLFRATAKTSRQVVRLCKHGFLKPVFPALYDREPWPFLRAYL
jgi:hypothetical protein